MPDIPDEVSLLWIAKFLGEAPSVIYKLNREGQGPSSRKLQGKYIVSKAAFLAWLVTREQQGKHGKQ